MIITYRNKIMKRYLPLALTLPLLLIGCSRTAYIRDIHQAPVPATATHLSQDQVRDIIISTVGKRRWSCQSLAPNLLICDQQARGHNARVNIKFSTQTFSINYVDSQGLRKKGDRIHNKYNRWIHRMKSDIQRALRTAAQRKS